VLEYLPTGSALLDPKSRPFGEIVDSAVLGQFVRISHELCRYWLVPFLVDITNLPAEPIHGLTDVVLIQKLLR
jgi:hypothetical protein